MVFSSIDFIFKFLPVFLIAYYITPNKYKNITLLLGSLFFYAWGDGFYVLLLLGSVFINFIMAKLIAGHGQYRQTQAQRKRFFWIAIAINFGLLVFFKYTNFLIDNINLVCSTAIPALPVVQPLGISFYTFQIVSYIIDVYRKDTRPANNIITLGAYLCMFPKLLQGPIATYGEIAPELRFRKSGIEDIEDGLRTFVLGLGAKAILADQIGTLWAGMSRYGYESMSTPYAWLGAFAYSFQLYFDFFGYSLMAIGVGKMVGITIPKNFDNPYISGSMAEFWRRWHMTLGRWFKQYIYFPLGGSRCSTWKIIRNTLIVWAFTGLWHGASWNFVLWGLSFFVFLTLERFLIGKYLEKTKVLKHIYVIFFIPLTWVIFALPNLSDIGTYFSRLFPFGGTPDFVTTKDFFSALKDYWYLLIACVVFCLPQPGKLYEKYKGHMVTTLILAAMFVYSMILVHSSASNPFLYFRF